MWYIVFLASSAAAAVTTDSNPDLDNFLLDTFLDGTILDSLIADAYVLNNSESILGRVKNNFDSPVIRSKREERHYTYAPYFKNQKPYDAEDGYGFYYGEQRPHTKYIKHKGRFFDIRNSRKFPDGSVFAMVPTITIPFIPFGIMDFRLPIAFFINRALETIFGFEYPDDGRGGALGRKKRSMQEDQLDLFEWIEDLLSNTLAIDGRSCVQRLICELSESPIKDRSFFGEIIHRVIEPRKDGPQAVNDYVRAESHGERNSGCAKLYGRCPWSVRKLMPEVFDVEEEGNFV